MALYRYKRRIIKDESGKNRYKYDPVEKIKQSEIKQTIMDVNGWNEEQYRKQYDLFKNKLRAYEAFTGFSEGKTIEEIKGSQQSPQELLYKIAKAKRREGENYKPSIAVQRIMAFSAESITKGRRKAQSDQRYIERRRKLYSKYTMDAFKGMIEQVAKAKEIDETIENPIKKEEALKALAEHIHAKQEKTGEVKSGETFGSDPAGDDFDFSQWED